MGYFTRKLSRQRCRAQVAAAEQRQARAIEDSWVAVPSVLPDGWPGTSSRERSGDRAWRAEVFVRFAVGTLDRRSQEQRGLLRAAGDLDASPDLPREARRELRLACRWFNKNLVAPSLRMPRAIFWFRSTSLECVAHVWALVQVFRDQGVPVWMLRSRRPGLVVYQDKDQVAAIPFMDVTRTRRIL